MVMRKFGRQSTNVIDRRKEKAPIDQTAALIDMLTKGVPPPNKEMGQVKQNIRGKESSHLRNPTPMKEQKATKKDVTQFVLKRKIQASKGEPRIRTIKDTHKPTRFK